MGKISKKLLILICSIVLGTYLLIAVAGSYEFRNLIAEKNEQSMTMLSKQKMGEVNVHMQSIENSVIVLEKYILEKINLDLLKSSPSYTEEFMNGFMNRAFDAAAVAGNNVTAIFFRLEPMEYGRTSGLRLEKNGYGGYNKVMPTDILSWPTTDREHVAWYYEPKAKGLPLWIEPYVNQKLNSYIISYVIPLYKNGKFFGVVGMDMNTTAIRWVVDSINYENGFGFIMTKRGSLIYHKDYPDGLAAVKFGEEFASARTYLIQKRGEEKLGTYTWHKEKHFLAGADILNGMVLAISAPESEVMKPYYRLRTHLLRVLACVIIAILFSLKLVMRHVIQPIGELTHAASRIAKGELNTPILYKSNDEIGKLSSSIRKMASELQEYINYIHKQAYTDAMTGVGNKAAYMDLIKLLERKIREGLAEFILVIFDVNGLKHTNDTMGHEAGDALITNTAKILKTAFGAERIFRIGGDEFVAVLEHTSQEEMERLFSLYNQALTQYNAAKDKEFDFDLSISAGFAIYTPGEEFKAVFQKADGEMYRNKELFYKRKNSIQRR